MPAPRACGSSPASDAPRSHIGFGPAALADGSEYRRFGDVGCGAPFQHDGDRKAMARGTLGFMALMAVPERNTSPVRSRRGDQPCPQAHQFGLARWAGSSAQS